MLYKVSDVNNLCFASPMRQTVQVVLAWSETDIVKNCQPDDVSLEGTLFVMQH